jgi:predicted ArsR family transcriptional regulator
MADWTFLTNHALVLIFLSQNTGITARELALQVGITERSVRKINADLENEGYLEKTKTGRRVSYKINHKLPFRHPTQRDQSIEKFLVAMGVKTEGRK